MSYLAIPEEGEHLRRELLDAAPLEAGAFCLLHRVVMGESVRLVLGDRIDSTESWLAQRSDLLAPSGRRISGAVSVATVQRCGLAFIHSHPRSRAPRLSALDRETTSRLGRTLGELLDGPFASLVVSPDGWCGALTEGDRLVDIDRIATVGRRVRLYAVPRADLERLLDDRQIRALGEQTQREIRSLRVGVIGAGGLGSPIAETLVRMGVGEVRLVDNDKLDTLSNARRIFGVTRRDVESAPPRAKAKVVADALDDLGLGAKVIPIVGDVRDSTVQEVLLDVDILISGTDTHSSRSAVSKLAVRAAVPLIDVGVRVGIRDGGQLDALRLERRVQVPGGPCLWCWRTLSAEQVRLELMPDSERECLAREGYVAGSTDGPAPSVAALTVTAAGAATSALLGIVSGAFDMAALGVGTDALTLDSAPFEAQTPDPRCVCARWRKGTN